MKSEKYIAKNTSLSLAWVEVFLELMKPGISEISPLVVTVSEFDNKQLPIQKTEVQRLIDEHNSKRQSCNTIANTIFPNSLWETRRSEDPLEIYDRYERIWPKIKNYSQNRKGVYFQRFISYEPKEFSGQPVNQLEHIIKTYLGNNHRHSALQASVFDPTQDHTNNKIRGFPCLQQVAFGVHKNELAVTGFYALQYHIEKAYGNYLGLCWLGRFMAARMGLKLGKVTCIASSLKLGRPSKESLKELERKMKSINDSKVDGEK